MVNGIVRKTTRTTYRKKRYGRRRKYKKRYIARIPTGSPVPDRMFTTMRYIHILTLGGTSIPYAQQQYRANDIYDPDYTGTGNFPLGYDQFLPLFSRYRVHSSKIVIKPEITSTQEANNYVIGVYPSNEAQGVGSAILRDNLARSYNKYMTTVRTDNSSMIKSYMKTSKLLGVSKAAVRLDDSFSAQMNAHPANPWFWTVYIGNLTQSGNTGMNAVVEIKYYVEFYDRKMLV